MTQRAVAGWRKVLDVLDAPIDVREADPGVELSAGSASSEFDSVDFAYRTGGDGRKDVSIAIPAGARVALVGPTGSGKTTLAKLLVRLADPTSGAVRVNGVDLREVSTRSLRSTIVMVPQEGFLFDTTIADNVQLSRPDLSDHDVETALLELGLDDWLAGLPMGVRTRV